MSFYTRLYNKEIKNSKRIENLHLREIGISSAIKECPFKREDFGS